MRLDHILATATAVSFALALSACQKQETDTNSEKVLASVQPSSPVVDAVVVDCPLRDEPYSIESPLMDLMLNPAAREIINRHMDSVLEKIDTMWISTVSPSFSSIINASRLVRLGGVSRESLTLVDKELRQLALTDADREARCARYDVVPPEIDIPPGAPRVLLFEKMTGFRDGPSVEAAAEAFRSMADRNGWALVSTDRGAVMTPSILEKFDVVIWNNVSGDVLTLTQREAFKNYIENGGGFVAVHGSGGDPIYFWDWYVDELIGARFIGHSFNPQFQDGRISKLATATGIGAQLPENWTMNDEWYSFATNPRDHGATVIATLDESSYSPIGRGGEDLRMGDEHPIAWSRCVVNGSAFYSAIGHRPQTYSDPNYVAMLEDAILWAAGYGAANCRGEAEHPQ